MSYVVRSSFGTFQFRVLDAAREAAYLTGGTLHRIIGRQNGKPVCGKALS